MVGEIRDAETARIAIESALTGHMVLSTLHTNRRPGRDHAPAEDGHRELPHRLGARLRGRSAAGPQALHGLQEAHGDLPGRAPQAGFRVGTDIEAYEPAGCARCNRTGFKGRIGVFSVMQMSERIKDLTVDGASEGQITDVAREEGMLSLREDGLDKVRAGVTSIAEVARVAS